MSYHDKVGALAQDAEQLEQVYHAALKAGETDAFKEAIDDSYRSAPESLLYAAWFHRLKHAAARLRAMSLPGPGSSPWQSLTAYCSGGFRPIGS